MGSRGTVAPDIDTRAPFRSVKEAVSLFGERVLAGKVYNPEKVKEIDMATSNQEEQGMSKLGSKNSELEETKQCLQKAQEETMIIATCLSSLQEELERTKRELQELKLERESEKRMMEFEIEHLKFIEDSPNSRTTRLTQISRSQSEEEANELQKKRYVTFANATVSQVVLPGKGGPVLQKQSSLKKKKQALIPMIGGIFSRKKKSSEVASAISP